MIRSFLLAINLTPLTRLGDSRSNLLLYLATYNGF
jgi:hypothetical protein